MPAYDEFGIVCGAPLRWHHTSVVILWDGFAQASVIVGDGSVSYVCPWRAVCAFGSGAQASAILGDGFVSYVLQC